MVVACATDAPNSAAEAAASNMDLVMIPPLEFVAEATQPALFGA
jgi:hypothetical protein